MTIIKPYTFQGGTKARANEVNENFDRLYAQVNINSSNIEDINTDIASIEEDKANVNGDATQVFNVKDPTSSYNAANKNYVDSKIASSLNNAVTTNTTQTITGNKTFTGTIKVPASATVGTPVTTAAIYRTSVQNQSAYIKFGNGIIIQWMKFTQNSDQQWHTWKINFTSGTSYCTCITQTGWGEDYNISVSNQSASSFQTIVEDQERGEPLYAIAVGY